MTNRRHLVCLLLVAALCSSGLCVANDVQFSGYLSQGVIYSDDNPFYDDDTGTNFNLRELGLNVSWQVSERLRVAGQVLSRKAGDLDDGDPKIDFLLLDYQYLVTQQSTAGIRLGRVKNPYGLYNLARDVPHGRPGIFVPQSVYFESLREALLSTNGGNLYVSQTNALGRLNIDAWGGVARFDNNAIEYQYFQKNLPGSFDEVDAVGLRIELEPAAIPNLTAAYTRIDYRMEYEDAPVFTPGQVSLVGDILAVDRTLYPSFLTGMTVDATMNLYSLQYAWQRWIWTGEFLSIDLDINDLFVAYYPLQDYKPELNGYYLQAEWLSSASLTLYLRYEELFLNSDDKDGKANQQFNGSNPVTQYNKAFTLGARYYFTPDLSITAEYSTNEGTAFINGQPDIDYPRLREDWDMAILQVSYHF